MAKISNHQDFSKIDQRALEVARQYMGKFQRPTLMLSIAGVGTYLIIAYAVGMGMLPAVVGALLLGPIGIALYVPFHEAVHRSISGRNRSLRWLNWFIGIIHGNLLGVPYVAHREGHLAHHTKTNEAGFDPDLESFYGRNVFAGAAVGAFVQYAFYLRERWTTESLGNRLAFIAETVGIVATRLVFALLTDFFTMATLMILGPFMTYLILGLVFNNLVHPEPNRVGRYVDTTNYGVAHLPRWQGRLVTWTWFYQNYHGIHHLFPKVPFYRLEKVYLEIEDVLDVRGGKTIELGKDKMGLAAAFKIEIVP